MARAFDEYILQKRIAVGGMAEIFLATQGGVEGFSKRIVLKLILQSLASEEEFVKMFIDEAKLAAEMTHPNIVQVFKLGASEGRYFIAMEYVPGIDVATLLKAMQDRGAALPPGAAFAIILDVLKALHFAHERKDQTGRSLELVHRDVSPQNILLSDDGLVKVTDFGIAKAQTQTTKTQSGVVKGKFAYMAPEQASGAKIDRRADLFAAALVLYEMLTMQRVYASDDEFETLEMARDAEIAPLAEVIPGFPPALSEAIDKAMLKDPEARYPDCLAFADALAREAPVLAMPYTPQQLGELIRGYREVNDPDQLPDVSGVHDPVLATQSAQVGAPAMPAKESTQVHRVGTRFRRHDYLSLSLLAVVLVGFGFAAARYLLSVVTSEAPAPPVATAPESEPPTPPAKTGAEPEPAAKADPPLVAVPMPVPVPPPEPPKTPPADRDDAARGMGYLSIGALPAAHVVYVVVDGKKLPKPTPVKGLHLSAGRHKLKLYDAQLKRTDEIAVEVKPQATTSIVYDFRKKRVL